MIRTRNKETKNYQLSQQLLFMTQQFTSTVVRNGLTWYSYVRNLKSFIVGKCFILLKMFYIFNLF